MHLLILFKQQGYLASLERNRVEMRLSLFLMFVLLSLLAGCSSEDRGNAAAEESNQEMEVMEVMSNELKLDFQVMPSSKETQFVITLTNQSEQLKKLEFHSSQKYEIIVTNGKGEEVFIYSKGKMFSQALETALIKSGESMEWEEIWQHESLPAGKYTAKMSILTDKDENLTVEKEWTVPSDK